MTGRLDWRRAKIQRPSTETAATRRLEYRADRYLGAVEPKQPKRRNKRNQKGVTRSS